MTEGLKNMNSEGRRKSMAQLRNLGKVNATFFHPFILARRSLVWIIPTHTRERNLPYSVNQFK
jgi:hypothetical protein